MIVNNKKIIIGFTGQIASGKGAAVQYLKEKYGAHTHRFSTALSDTLNRLYLDNSRENLQRLSEILRENFGKDILARIIHSDVEHDQHSLIAIDGIRRPDDVQYLRQLSGFVLVHIFADIKKRYERILARGEKTDDAQKTLEQFNADHQREAEQKIAEIAREATEMVDNNGTREQLCAQLDALIKKYEN